MTKIILHGGYRGNWDNAGEDVALFQKLVNAAVASDHKIMISYLAYETPSDFIYLDKTLETFHALSPAVKITIAGRNNFRELLPQHHVLFLQGGNSQMQSEALLQVSKEELLEGKTLLAGSSSGAMQLCRYGYSRSSNGVIHGKGIVDLALMPHADVWPVADYVPELRAVTDLPIVQLNEMQFIELSC